MLIQCNKKKALVQMAVPINRQSRQKKEENVRYCPIIEEDFIESMYPNVRKCLDVIHNRAKLSEKGDCLGYHMQIKKSYKWITYEQFIERIKDFGAGLINLGCKPSNYSKICIYSINRVEWSIAQYGCYSYSIVVVPLYETISIKQRSQIINEVDAEVIVVDNINRIKSLLETRTETPFIKLIICMDNDLLPSDLENMAKKYSITILPFSSVEKLGRTTSQPIVAPEPSDLAMIMYTSGTCSEMKGVMLTHKNFVASASGLLMHMSMNINVGELTFLSLLPMSHSFEQCVQTTLLMAGARIGFYSGDIKLIAKDMQALKPSVLVLVPRLMNRIYNSVMAETSKSHFKSMMLRKALMAKQKEINNFIYRKNTFFDKLVLKRLRAKLGGNIRLLASGSAPISPTIMNFFRCALSCVVVEGYGLTETCGASVCSIIGDYTTGHVGVPLCSSKYKLIDVPELKYTFRENRSGEICIQGKNVFIGEFVAPEKVENVYVQCFRGAMLCGWRFHTGSERSISLTLEEACQNPSFKKTVFEDMHSVGVREGLNGLEQVKEIQLHSEAFTVENNLLTPTMKIKRNKCRERFKPIVKKLYNQSR